MKLSFVTPRRVLCLIGVFALLGMAFAVWLGKTFAGFPDPRTGYNAFYVLFARDEVLGLALVAVFSFSAAFLFFRSAEPSPNEQQPGLSNGNSLHVALIAAGVLAVAAFGTELVCHNYALSADEFMAEFQAQIFLRGKITAEIPTQWLPAIRLIKPTYVDYLPQTHSWKATYLPVYAALRALFQSVDLQSLLNPLLAAVTVVALYGTVRQIWPNDQKAAFVAVLLLASAPQFLVMSMTVYSMPAHLAFNTIWLWLYSRPNCRQFYLAPAVGVLAIGLHQPIVHALFVAPFLLRLVWQRKWRVVSIFAIVYSLGCAAWYAWRLHYQPPAARGIDTFLHLFNFKMIVVQPMDLLLIVGWSSLAAPLLFVLGSRLIFRERSILQDAAFSCFLTFGFYYFFYLDQSHGWGYRYFHGTLSCFVLIAVAGWKSLGEKLGARCAREFLAIGVAASLLLALPLRCYQAESFIRPFARASRLIQSSKVQVVGVNVLDGWYSADLVRNDPFLENSPIVAAAIRGWMTPAEVTALSMAGQTRFIGREELAACGLATAPHKPELNDPFHLGRAQ